MSREAKAASSSTPRKSTLSPAIDGPLSADPLVLATLATDAALPVYVTVDEAARLLSISRTHAWKLVNTGVIPSVRLSARVVRVPLAALRDLAAGRNGAAPDAPLARPCASEHPERPGRRGSAL